MTTTRDTFLREQIAASHRRAAHQYATTIRGCARAARQAGLDAITLKLPTGDANLLAAALNEWANDRQRAAAHTAHQTRKDTP